MRAIILNIFVVKDAIKQLFLGRLIIINQNKFNMDAFKSIPKFLNQIDDIRHGSRQSQILVEYKKNVKLFISTITKQVSEIIQKYQQKIAQLKAQNKMLKQGKSIQKGTLPLQTATKNQRTEQKPSSKFVLSGRRTPNLDMIQTAKSNLFAPFQQDIRFSAVLSKYKKTKDQDSNFPVELINPQPGEDQNFRTGKSQFQLRGNRKKQREEELRTFLQSGKNNLNLTTKKFLEIIGRHNNKQEEDNRGHFELAKDHSDTSLQLKKNQSGLNKSLGDICNSLDTSYASKRARNNKRKKSCQIQDQAKKKLKNDQEIAKMMKNKGIKNLLSRLRDNVQASPNKSPQIIKSSKLISCGPSKSKIIDNGSRRNSSKVLINPVPVDIARKSKATKRDRSMSPEPNTPSKKPHSILKQSNIGNREPQSPTKSILKQGSSILSKSISEISAIDFAN